MNQEHTHSIVKAAQGPSTESPATTPASLGQSMEKENIDKIRDILFGAQLRQYDQRFIRLEESLHQEIINLRNETKKTFTFLEDYIKREFATLSEQVKTEQTERTETVEELARKLNDATRILERKITQLHTKSIQEQRQLQEQILQQSKNLMEELREKHETLSTSLDRACKELRNDKTDRVALANLLMEVGMRLKDEFSIDLE